MATGGGGDRGNRGGGDRASRGGFGGGFPGGGMMPGGGFPGGGMMPGGGFPGGGMPGGGFGGMPGGGFGGGFPGGGFGGFRGGDRGGMPGFNPADMLKRFDRNNNNMIDPDEAEGPARFFLERMAQNNPKIDLSRPVPLDTLAQEMDRMRNGGMGGEDASSSSDQPALLVPDFTVESQPSPIPGFGSTDSAFNVKVIERDLKEAEERIRRYDRNGDGILNKEELSGGRWNDDPLQYDRNQDGRLTKSELAVRYARRRVDEQQAQSNPSGQNGANSSDRSRGWGMWGQANSAQPNPAWNRTPEAAKEEEEKDRPKSYRMKTAAEKSTGTKGLPDWFNRSDADGDGQVELNEYSSSLTAATIVEFQKFDGNRDGMITAAECLKAIKDGATRATSGSASPSSSTASGASPSSTPSSSATPAATGGSSGGKVTSDQLVWAEKQITKYDKNGDKRLTPDEWSSMIVKPDGADADKDGAITVEEYAAFRAKR